MSQAKVNCLTDLPATRAYLARIGAEPRSLKQAVIRETRGAYWKDLAVIRFSKSGEVECSDQAYLPTGTEAAAIKEEFGTVKWPQIKPLSKIVRPPDEIKNAEKKNIFEFRNHDGMIVMVHVRVEREGEKNYLPFSYWDDDTWRQCEPDGPLPLYGADRLKDAATVFIHEGAKAAKAVQTMVDGLTEADRKRLAAHPWGQELVGAVHLGWIGGAMSPYRTDWSLLRSVTRIFIVADRDDPGEAAIPKISRLLAENNVGAEVYAVRFPPDRFSPSFDLADHFPSVLFLNGAYCGPAFRDCFAAATWATDEITLPLQGRGRPKTVYRLRPAFAQIWRVVSQDTKPLYVCPPHICSREAFNIAVRPFSHVAHTADLLEQEFTSHVQGIGYVPGKDEGQIVTIEGIRCVNVYSSPNIRPADGDSSRWTDFLEHLIPDEAERKHVARWCATLIARPDIRMRYGLLLASPVQGVGKTTLGLMLRMLVGERNTSTVSEKDIVESQFNSYLVRKRLVICNEIYSGKSWSAYHKLKSEITEEDIQVNEKFIPQYGIKNWAHLFLCSNSTRPLSMTDDDRRFLIPRVTEAQKPKEYWTALYSWINGGGAAIVARWAQDFVLEHGPVETGDHAPMTDRKRELIEDSRSEAEAMVRDLGTAALDRSERVILVQKDVDGWLAPTFNGKAPDGANVRRWLRDAGMFEGTKRVKVDGRMQPVLSNRPISDNAGWPELKDFRFMPGNLIRNERAL